MKYMSLEKRKINMRTFFESQFTYCPLIWMFCDRGLNRKINHLHERALCIAYNHYDSLFDLLLGKDDSCNQSNKFALLIDRNVQNTFKDITSLHLWLDK